MYDLENLLLDKRWGLIKDAQFVLIKPNSSLFFSNYSLFSALVKISAICSLVAQKFIETKPF